MRNKRRNKRKKLHKFDYKKMLIIILSILLFSIIFAVLNSNNETFLYGVSINGINLSGLTYEEGEKVLKENFDKNLSKEIILKKDNFEISISANQISSSYNYDKILDETYLIGRCGNIVQNNFQILKTALFKTNVSMFITYNENLLKELIEDVSLKIPNIMQESSFYVENDKLIIISGKSGNIVNKEELKNLIISNINNQESEKTMEIPTIISNPKEINIQKIKEEVCKQSQDAYIEKQTNKVHVHVDGVEFAISDEEIKNMLQEKKEEYVIDLKIIPANKTVNDLGEGVFVDELSKSTTKYDASYIERSINIELASKKINGVMLMPGEEFSFNKVVGNRTVKEGYQEAAIYANGQIEQGLGGGICQVSSTLYNAVVLANLEIVERRNHYFCPSYINAGMDATVSWGTIDFRFKNSRSYPIKISSQSKNGVVVITITGIKEENECEIIIQTDIIRTVPYPTINNNDITLEKGTAVIEQNGKKGLESETYKIKKLGNVVLSKELLSKDVYNPIPEIIKISN